MKNNLLLTFALMMGLFTLNAQTTILDFETPATTAQFEYFGSSLPGGFMDVAIPNPAPGGINTSATVGQFDKPAGSEVWAGAFADPSTLIDFTTDNEICLKVWLNEPTNLLLKVEGSTNSAPNWEFAQQIDETQTWVDVCYNVESPSAAGPFQPATGGIYSRLVLFFDFGTSLGAPQVYYFDDITVKTGELQTIDVTFSVDMSNYTEAFDSLFVSGTFNNFDDNSNPLDDSDGDNVWTTTVEGLAPGNYEYLFQLDKFDLSLIHI